MSLYSIKDTTLTAIGDAIREKTGSADTYKPTEMATAIQNITTGGGDIEPVVLTGSGSYTCTGAIAESFIANYPNKVSTSGLANTNSMFRDSKLTSIPFELNYTGSSNTVSGTFYNCKMETVPKMNNVQTTSLSEMFASCSRLTTIRDDLMDNWVVAEGGYQSNSMFSTCSSLRYIPTKILKTLKKYNSSSYSSPYYSTFTGCLHLNEIVGLGVITTNAITANYFSACFNNCSALRRLTFETNEDGTPIVANWKNQTIDLTTNVGYYGLQYTWYKPESYLYNSGVTLDKIIKDDATYTALKDDPDGWVCDYVSNQPVYYSFYNQTSAIETIQSLPDCSSSGGTNTIKFKGASGQNTDGGAIQDMAQEWIDLAASKGWTVTFV